MAVFTQVVGEFGFAFRRDAYERCLGTTKEGTRRVLTESYGPTFPFDEIADDFARRSPRLT